MKISDIAAAKQLIIHTVMKQDMTPQKTGRNRIDIALQRVYSVHVFRTLSRMAGTEPPDKQTKKSTLDSHHTEII